jgi:hypothetical protein
MLTRWKLAAVPFLGALCLALLPAFGVGEEKGEKTTKQPKPGPLTAKAKEALQGIEQTTLAYSLADWGRKAKSPAALIAAAQLLAEAQPRDLAAKAKVEGAEEVKAPTPHGLLKEAAELSDSPQVAALIKDVQKDLAERKRGRNPGPFVGIFDMAPRATFAMKIGFKGGETAICGATAQGGGEIRLTVSNPIEGWSKSDQGPAVRVQWFQAEFGEVVMSRNNLTDQPVRCYVYTN